MRSFFRWLVLAVSVIMTIYRFRFKLLNIITTLPLLRKWLVRSTMNIPWVRQKMLSKMFQT
ncbi:hypothetical protein Q7A53_01715 [Halobacillus rhizosphaerae]|uniref:hypothetical protein n=1 Tax=Halobacillus rhizosphaerae TaxID=3064889 RepID=UPI00398B4049